jgi:hypothetical protein
VSLQELPDPGKLPNIVFVKYRLTSVIEVGFYIDEATYQNLNSSRLEEIAVANANYSPTSWTGEEISSEVVNDEH